MIEHVHMLKRQKFSLTNGCKGVFKINRDVFRSNRLNIKGAFHM